MHLGRLEGGAPGYFSRELSTALCPPKPETGTQEGRRAGPRAQTYHGDSEVQGLCGELLEVQGCPCLVLGLTSISSISETG